ncbi:hypothetical protein [Microvirga sp. KLBC 81]|uniref:hypothetical protein n=1 Tax=Microvirga sp. KLBC 81 TaxID=1862707 RepID=UPI000E2FF914|nr:hypothetical protein [Microvirga sp. KLBC 81]
MCRHDQHHLNRVADVCADDSEVLALAVLRFVAAGYMTSDVACWDAAHDAAERALGPIEGPQFVATMTGIMRSIRRECMREWRFLPATCCRTTADEERLIKIIAYARHGFSSDAHEAAAALMGGVATCLCDTVSSAAERLNQLQTRLAPSASQANRASIH